jgi:hypothetical protein
VGLQCLGPSAQCTGLGHVGFIGGRASRARSSASQSAFAPVIVLAAIHPRLPAEPIDASFSNAASISLRRDFFRRPADWLRSPLTTRPGFKWPASTGIFRPPHAPRCSLGCRDFVIYGQSAGNHNSLVEFRQRLCPGGLTEAACERRVVLQASNRACK